MDVSIKTKTRQIVCMAAAAGIMLAAGCGDGGGTEWLEVTEAALAGDWSMPVFRGQNMITYMTLSPDGVIKGGTFGRWEPYCYWSDMQIYDDGEFWYVGGKDTLYVKTASKNYNCWERCEGEVSRFSVQVSANKLRLKYIDYILTSGDTVPVKDYDWDTYDYDRVDAARIKENLKNRWYPMPVFSEDLSLTQGWGWVNNAGESLYFWTMDDNGDYDYAFIYEERDGETGDFTRYINLMPSYGCTPLYYTVSGANSNRLVLKNATADGQENLGDLEFEYTITTTPAFDDILKMRRLVNGEPAGEFQTWERLCNASICGDQWPEGSLPKRLKGAGINGAKCRRPPPI
ncbi:MAG: hypothetical protein FWC23_03910 [Chitinispirillia bacterium]|nr:hypothetical protein [Chitinispirillia bacterium]MCL2268316.1 hypothetical protein [Chitinispirillia bacterium]